MSGNVTTYKVLFAGGGTGGHLFPAIAVAEQIKEMKPETEILFVGTKTRIEGRMIPKIGYKFKSIWIKGFSRKFNIENLLFPVKLIVSVIQSIFINMKFQPKVAIGSGGYVSGPALFGSYIIGAKIILLEQNSYPGVTTRLLERYADEVHISFKDSDKYLRRKEKIILTGNPVRKKLGTENKITALQKFGLTSGPKTLLVLGGSLGAGSINEAVANNVLQLEQAGIQIIWQTGSTYFAENRRYNSSSVKVYEFIEDMNSAYSACDLLLARAGATTIAEILVLGIPSILIPSPNVAENHQFYNAKSLSDKNAAVLINDDELNSCITNSIVSVIYSENKLIELKNNAIKLAKPDAARNVAINALKYMEGV